jgi:PIN domain nuclease of toxin-antitoxin system
MHHRDPFDRMLAVQALEDGFTLVSRDEVFRTYSVATVW